MDFCECCFLELCSVCGGCYELECECYDCTCEDD